VNGEVRAIKKLETVIQFPESLIPGQLVEFAFAVGVESSHQSGDRSPSNLIGRMGVSMEADVVAGVGEIVKPTHEIGILVECRTPMPSWDHQKRLVADAGFLGQFQEAFTGCPASRMEIMKGNDQ